MRSNPILMSVILIAGASSTYAYEVHQINTPDNQPAFEMRYFNPGDPPFDFYLVGDEDPDDDDYSKWKLQPKLIKQIDQGVSYWASLIKPQGGRAIINVGTEKEKGNASASSPPGNNFDGPKTLMQMQLQGDPLTADDKRYGMHATFGLGKSETEFPDVTHFSQIPLSGKDEIVATAIHELGHGFGIVSPIDADEESDDHGYLVSYKPYFNDPINRSLGFLMVDDNGNHAKPGQEIWCDDGYFCADPDSSDFFDVRNDNALLIGKHINEALDGGLPGIPISMLATASNGIAVLDEDNMSHLELKNSLMSHQSFRNYMGFMEAELALLQDLGYDIDRRNFFGRSIYGSGMDIVNTRGYFARNASGTAYIPGKYNTAILGLGLHVYGSHNKVRQAADILTSGPGGAGVRVDGEGNHLVIDPGVRVYADGDTGQGIMFTYGKNHSLVQRGDVQALGPRGVGIRFDFGHNSLTDKVESRGSYIHTSEGTDLNILDELDGPLVDQVDITGRVAGRKAAIYIAENAYVKQINLMQGAKLQGDIVSLYDEYDDNNNKRITTLSFGQKANASGIATGNPDPNFIINYHGDIKGDSDDSNINLELEGGTSILQGNHQIWSVTIHPYAILAGHSSYEIESGEPLLNQGTLIAGSDNTDTGISINGGYTQAQDATLMTTFNADGAFGKLKVDGPAELTGTVGIRPVKDWYPNNWSTTVKPVQANSVVGTFNNVGLSQNSPTLKFSLDDPSTANIVLFSAGNSSANQYKVSVKRPANAYTQYANSSNDRQIGQALSQLAAAGLQDSGDLFASLDFSQPNGSDISSALPQLSASAYSAATAASIRQSRMALDTALHNNAKVEVNQRTNRRSSGWHGYASLFGSSGQQNKQSNIIANRNNLYGVIAGTSHWLESNPNVLLGIAVDASEQTTDLRSSWSGQAKTTAFGISGQLRFQPDMRTGPYALSGIRLGIERSRMTRNIGFADYSARHKSSWTGFQAGVQIAGGYQFAIDEATSIGPYVSLDYTRVNRPTIEESGPKSSQLKLNSLHKDALRSRLGITLRSAWELSNGTSISAHAMATWNHELLARDVHQRASFNLAPNASFNSSNQLTPRNLLGISAGLEWQKNDRLSIGAELGSQLGNSYKSIDGQVNVKWAF